MRGMLMAILLLFTACATEAPTTDRVPDAGTEMQEPVETEEGTEEITEEGTEEETETEPPGEETETTSEAKEPETETTTPPIVQADLASREGLQANLQGTRRFNHPHVSDMTAELRVEEGLKYTLIFVDAGGRADELTGVITKEEKQGAGESSVIRFEDEKGSVPSEFYIARRTVHAGKDIMGLYHIGDVAGPFDVLTPEENHVPRELLFEKETGAVFQGDVPASAEFFAVFWDTGEIPPSLWMDPVELNQETAPAGDPAATSPFHNYTNENPGTILFTLRPEVAETVLSGELLPGTVYRVKTDEKGAILEMTPAEVRFSL